MDKRRRIVWTTRQNEMVGRKAAELIFNREAKSDIRAVDQAQHLVLEQDFHRTIVSKKSISECKSFLEKRLAELQRGEPSDTKPPTAALDSLAESERRRIARDWLAHVAENPFNEPKETKVGQALSLLATGLAQQFALEFKKEFELALSTAIAESLEVARERVANDLRILKAETKPKPTIKIVVVGLLADQMNIIREKFEDTLDIKFYKADDSTHRIHEAAKTAHATVIMTNFISHSVDRAAQSSKNLHRLTGGMHKLEEKLTEIYVNLMP